MISHLNTFGGGAGIEPGAVGDYHWTFSQSPGTEYYWFAPSSYGELTTAVSLAIGDTVSFEYLPGVSALGENSRLISSSDDVNFFGFGVVTPDSVVSLNGFTATRNGVAIVNGDYLPCFNNTINNDGRGRWQTIVLTATVATDIQFIGSDNLGGLGANYPIRELEVVTTGQTYYWPITNKAQAANQTEQNIGTNTLIIRNYSKPPIHQPDEWRTNIPIESEAVGAIEDDALFYNTDQKMHLLAFNNASLRSDGSGSSFDLTYGPVDKFRPIMTKHEFLISYGSGFTFETLIEYKQLITPHATLGGGFDLMRAFGLWAFQIDNWNESDFSTDPISLHLVLIKREGGLDYFDATDTLHVEVDMSGSVTPSLNDIVHAMFTLRPSDNTAEMWFEGVSQGTISIPVNWWDNSSPGSIHDIKNAKNALASESATLLQLPFSSSGLDSSTRVQDTKIHLLEADQDFVDKQYNDVRGRRSKTWNSTFESKMSIEGSFAGDSPEVDVNGSFSSIVAYPGSTVVMGANFSANSTNSIINWNGRLFIAFDATSTAVAAEAGFRLATNGELRRKIGSGSGYAPYNNWLFGTGHLSTIGNGYEVKFSLNSGTLPTTGAALIDGATWHNLGTERDISIESIFKRFSEISATIRVVGDATTEKTSTLFIETANYL